MVQRLRATTGASTAVCSLKPRSSPSRCWRRVPGSRGGRFSSRAGLTVGANRLRDRLDVLEELLPGLGRALLVLLDPLDRVGGCSLDVALVGPQDLRLQLERRGPEDLADRSVVEERV